KAQRQEIAELVYAFAQIVQMNSVAMGHEPEIHEGGVNLPRGGRNRRAGGAGMGEHGPGRSGVGPAPKPATIVRGNKASPNQARLQRQYGMEMIVSKSHEAHEEAWRALGHQEKEVPIVYELDNKLYVDKSRWPKGLPLDYSPPGGPYPNPPKPPPGWDE